MVDADLRLDDIFGDIKQALIQLAPFGTGNLKPLFSFTRVSPTDVTQFGKAKEHLKLQFTTDKGPIEAIAFFATETSFAKTPQSNEPLTLLAHIETSFFMGRKQTRLRIINIV